MRGGRRGGRRRGRRRELEEWRKDGREEGGEEEGGSSVAFKYLMVEAYFPNRQPLREIRLPQVEGSPVATYTPEQVLK